MTIETEGPAPKRRRTARKRKADATMAAPLPIEQQPLVPVEDNPANQSDGKPTTVDDNPANEVPGFDKVVVRDNDANEVPDPVKDVEPVDDPYPDPVPPQEVEPIPELPPNEMVPVLVPVPGGAEPLTTPAQPQPEPEPDPEPEVEPEQEAAEAGGKPPASSALVRVKCISYAKPWTSKGPLRYGEQVKVPQDLADRMVRNGHVEVV